MRVRVLIGGALSAAVLAAGAGYAALGGQDAEAEATPAAAVRAEIADWRWAPRDALPDAPAAKDRADADDEERPEDELLAARPQRTQPEPDPPAADADDAAAADAEDVPAPRQQDRDEPPPALPDFAESAGDESLVKAEVLKNGVALPPLEAPAEVRAIFEAGNTIARSPYKWGGGHGKWQDSGYDCSGSVSYALAAAGLVTASMPSGGYMKWGKPGKGKWITIYTNPGHMFMVVAGVRFDTVARGQTGSRWIESPTSTAGYVARHPVGF